jgi:hypothetical protein
MFPATSESISVEFGADELFQKDLHGIFQETADLKTDKTTDN